jgi:hypothetical protein
VIVNLPGTPHWLSDIADSIEYFEIQIPNMDPAPGIRALSAAGSEIGTRRDALKGVPAETSRANLDAPAFDLIRDAQRSEIQPSVVADASRGLPWLPLPRSPSASAPQPRSSAR